MLTGILKTDIIIYHPNITPSMLDAKSPAIAANTPKQTKINSHITFFIRTICCTFEDIVAQHNPENYFATQR